MKRAGVSPLFEIDKWKTKDQKPGLIVKKEFLIQNGKAVSKVKVGKYWYSTHELLGKGYTSQVYKATLITDPKKKFAIKVINLKKFQKPEDLALIQRQIEIIKKLKHPNIIECFDVLKAEDFYYIITEYCPHGDLQELIQAQKVLNEDVALNIIKQVIEAYKFIIGKNIIHRDLKPANIMRFGSVWKIGDFGFATYCLDDFVLDEMNVGTPLYMPPESIYYNKYSFKTDIFSLGIIFYQMLTGSTPWPSTTENQLIKFMEGEKMEIPELIKDPCLREFLLKTCHIDYYSRMSKDELKKFTFTEVQERMAKSKTKSTPYSSKSLKKVLLLSPRNSKSSVPFNPFQDSLKNEKAKFQYFRNQRTQPDNIQTRIKTNLQKIRCQEKFCTRIVYTLENISSLKLQKEKNGLIITVFYKYLLKLMKMLANPKQNALKLTDWDVTKKHSQFKKIQQQVAERIEKYEQRYSDTCKKIPSETIKYVNIMFPQLSSEIPLTHAFYTNFEPFLKQFIIENIITPRNKIKFVPQIQFNQLKLLKTIYSIVKERKKKTSRSRQLNTSESQSRKNEEQFIQVSNEYTFKKILQSFVLLFNDQ